MSEAENGTLDSHELGERLGALRSRVAELRGRL
jgi:hypothetical protein